MQKLLDELALNHFTTRTKLLNRLKEALALAEAADRQVRSSRSNQVSELFEWCNHDRNGACIQYVEYRLSASIPVVFTLRLQKAGICIQSVMLLLLSTPAGDPGELPSCLSTGRQRRCCPQPPCGPHSFKRARKETGFAGPGSSCSGRRSSPLSTAGSPHPYSRQPCRHARHPG